VKNCGSGRRVGGNFKSGKEKPRSTGAGSRAGMSAPAYYNRCCRIVVCGCAVSKEKTRRHDPNHNDGFPTCGSAQCIPSLRAIQRKPRRRNRRTRRRGAVLAEVSTKKSRYRSLCDATWNHHIEIWGESGAAIDSTHRRRRGFAS